MKIRINRLGLSALCLLLVVGGLGLLSPWWLPLAAKPIGRSYGIEWATVNRIGWHSWTFQEVRLSLDSLDLTVDSLEIPQPFPWLASGLGTGDKVTAEGGILLIQLKEPNDPVPSAGSGIGIELLDSIRRSILEQQQWIPLTRLGRLEITDPRHKPILTLENLSLTGPSLSGSMPTTMGMPALGLSLWLSEGSMRLAAIPASPGPDASLLAVLAPASPTPNGWFCLDSRGNALVGTASWQAGTWLPEQIELQAENWHLPIESSEDLVLDLRLRGDTKRLEITTFNLHGDWLEARLSDPVQYQVGERSIPTTARFRLQADLSRQQRFPASGKLEGEVVLQPGSPWQAETQFSLFGSDLANPQVAIEQLQVIGSYSIRTGAFLARGSYTLDPRTMETRVPGIGFTTAVSGTFTTAGNREGFTHSGSIQPVPLLVEKLRPLSASLDWEGTGTKEIQVAARLESESGDRARATLEADTTEEQRLLVVVREVVLENADRAYLSLEQPFTLAINPGLPFPVERVPRFRLSGDSHYVQFEWDRGSNRFGLEAENFDPGMFSGWLQQEIPPLMVGRLSAQATRFQPSLVADLTLRLHAIGEHFTGTNLSLLGRIDESGIHLNELEASVSGNPIISGNLELPLLLHPVPGPSAPPFTIIPERPLSGHLSADVPVDPPRELADIPFLDSLAGLHMELLAGGTPENPDARLTAQTENLNVLQLLDEDLADYPLEKLNLVANVSMESLRIEEFRAGMRGSRINLSGSLPTESILAFISGKDAVWERLLHACELDFTLENLFAREFSPLLPPYLRSTGKVSGSLAIRPGPQFTGQLEMHNFGLRPTLYSQTVEDIDLTIDIADNRFSIARASALIGNSQVGLSGYLDVSDLESPVYAFQLNGVRTPLIRTPDLLLHGDLDLQLDGTDPARPASLTGSVTLSDGVLLLDIEPLAARTTGSQLPKPPFFSVSQQPFSDWRLDVDIAGQDFIRFRSAYVKTLLSANLDLSGTLANPVWVGNVYTSEGNVDFPGLRTDLNRSEVFVTREQQDSLQLDINTIGRVASYILSLQISGSVDDPHVELAATPDLSNAQILQLLATGSIDGSGLGSVGLYFGKGFFATGAGDSLWDRFAMEIGRDVTESSKETIDLYYDLTKRLRLHGEYDKYDAQNLNLEWEVYSK